MSVWRLSNGGVRGPVSPYLILPSLHCSKDTIIVFWIDGPPFTPQDHGSASPPRHFSPANKLLMRLGIRLGSAPGAIPVAIYRSSDHPYSNATRFHRRFFSHRSVAFLKDSLSSLNSYGYSPYPLATYLGWVEEIISQDENSHKPFIISITSYSPVDFSSMLDAIQRLRTKSPLMKSRIGVELNTSCPNIKGSPPPSYQFSSLVPLLDVLARHFWEDQTLTIGLKLPPYVASSQFVEVVQGISGFTRMNEETGKAQNPFAFFTCTNTLGCSLAFAEQSREIVDHESQFAVPPGLGGLAGEAIHSLSLGNVFSFARLLAESPDAAMRDIVIIGVGGVTSPEAAERMRRAGAKIVGCATLLGQQGVMAFQHLTEKSSK